MPCFSYKWYHVVFVSLWLSYFIKFNVLEAYPGCSMCQFPLFLGLNNIPLCVYHILFSRSSFSKHLGCCHLGCCE
jgi:hypothetical protein